MRKLETRMLNYFLLISFAAIMIGMEFYVEMGSPDIRQILCNPGSMGEDGLSQLRNKIIIMLGMITVVVAIVWMMFIKNITMPLRKIVNVAEKITQGDLRQVIEIETGDEIGQVGNTINALTSNLQEMAAYTSVSCNEALKQLDSINKILESGKTPERDEIEVIREKLNSIIEFSDSFKLL